MKAKRKMLLCYLLGLAVMAVSAWAVSVLWPTPPKGDDHGILWLIPAAVLMLVALAAHFLGKHQGNWAYVVGYYLNAVASGWCIGILMGEKGMIPTPELLLAMLPAVVLGLLAPVLFHGNTDKWNIGAGIDLIVSLLLFLGGIGVWIWLSSTVGCTLVFSMLFLLPFPFCVAKAEDKPLSTYRYLSYSGFGAFFLISFVVLVVLSEGEALDGLSFDLPDFGGRKKK